jgi:shikimate kinase
LESKDRPLVNPEKGWEDVKECWMQRQKLYEDADYIIDTDNLTPEQCAQEIIDVIGL